MEQHQELTTLIAQYKSFIADEWIAAPAGEADILAIAGCRDEIHWLYIELDKVQQQYFGKQITELDAMWQRQVKESMEPGFMMDYPKTGHHWWYNLDKLNDPAFDLKEI